jgi:hypothetical protein
MKTKIMGTLAILLIGLSLAGLVYAHWVDTATIKGNVTMGSLTFGFSKITDEWDSEYFNDYSPLKCSATTYCTMSDRFTDVHTGLSVNRTLTFAMVNATPEYWGINVFSLDNAGTIPVKIQNVTIKNLPADFGLVESIPGICWDVYNHTTGKWMYEIWLYEQTEEIAYIRYDVGYFGPPWGLQDVFGLSLSGLKGIQIDKGGSAYTEMCVYIPETAQICHTYPFDIHIDAIQWNLYTP